MPAVPLQSLWSVTAPAGPACAALTTACRAPAADIGTGASVSNGGQVIPGVKHDPDTLEQMFGPDAGARAVATVASGPDLVFELIARHGLRCDAVRSGWIQLAASEAALAQLAARVGQWRCRG